MIAIIVMVFLMMVLGNAVLSSSGDALYRLYGALVAGDISVSADAETNFTVFGSDQLLVGEYIVLDVVPEFERLRTAVESLGVVRASAGLVSAVARIEIGDQERVHTLFGVDFVEYQALFPDLELVAGSFPRLGEPGIVVQESWLVGEDSVDMLLGRPALLASGTGRTFTLREVPVRGVFRYPVNDDLLSTIALVDADTARALNGYLYGALEEVDLSADDEALLDADVDALFAEFDGESTATSDDSETIDLSDLFGAGSSDHDQRETERSRETISGTWNFLLVALHDQRDRGAAIRRLTTIDGDEPNGYRVRPWWGTVGGNASLVRYLQILFNAGLLFVATGAAIIATNALVLSVLERTSEIGTMRALGATRARVALLITVETILVVISAAAAGIVFGTIAVRLLNVAEYSSQNQYISILFGGRSITGIVTARLIATHLAAALLLALAAVIYPIERALAISPREAMAA